VQNRGELFLQAGAIDSMSKILKNASDENTKMEIFKVLSTVCYKNEQCAVELCKRGISILLKEDLVKRARGIKLISEFIIELLKLLRTILESLPQQDRSQNYRSEFGSDVFVKSMITCLTSGKRQTRLEALRCYGGLCENQKVRKLFDENSGFTAIFDSLQRGIEDKDDCMICLSIYAISKFCEDVKYHTLMRNMDNEGIQFSNSIVSSLSFTLSELDKHFVAFHCNRSIIRLIKLLSDTPEQKSKFIKEGIFACIVPSLQSDCSELKQDAVSLIIQYAKDFALKESATLTILSRHIFPLLNDKNDSVIISALDSLYEISKSQNVALSLIKNDGLTAIMNLLTSQNNTIIATASKAISILIQYEQGREIYVLNNGLILSFTFIVFF